MMKLNHVIDVFVHDANSTSATSPVLERLLAQLKEISMNQDELAAALTDLGAVLDKVSGETTALVAEVATLTTAVTATSTTPAVDSALKAVQDRVAGIDALVPDSSAVPTP